MDRYRRTALKLGAVAIAGGLLAMSGQASPTNPEFTKIMSSQWSLVQQMAKLNTDLMMGIMSPKK